ncbi:hemicentin-2-like isoform X2 [Anneissia japonica]|uniref:hemicentin-2-like isoform X2 n=1 Tax=Anneissia japonica TaxID=1529436 RepID=UPI0014258A97|nr:hemicentin-2-like isoform X2 [Anneissia japonica]
MTMATKSTCYIIISMTVFISTCLAVIVTVNDIGDKVEGSETRIQCNIIRSSSNSTNDPIVTWNNVTNEVTDQIAQYQNGGGLVQPSYSDRFSVDADTTLVITNTRRSDSGTYQCSVSILDDPPSPASADVTLIVKYLYKPVLSSFTTPVTEGDTVEMLCSADANPSPTYTFLKDGGEVQPPGASSTFRIQSVSRDKDGSYECRASNSAGTETSESRMLDVQYPPEITPLSNIEVSRGESVTISFVVVANPTATYTWNTLPATTDTDNNPETYTFTVSDTIGDSYTVNLTASNDVGTTPESVKVTVVARITTLMTTTNALTTLPPPDSCGALSIVSESHGNVVDGAISAQPGEDVTVDCRCGGSSSGNGFKYEWTLDGENAGTDSDKLSFKAVVGGHDVVCKGTAGAPEPSEVSLSVNVAKKEKQTSDPLSTGAIVGIVIGIIVVLVILAVVIVIVLKAREDGPSNKSADSAYMDVTWDTKDPNRVNQGKKTAPPINGNSKQEAAKPDPYEKYDRYGDERAYSRTSYGDDYNDKPDEDDYANSMPVTV